MEFFYVVKATQKSGKQDAVIWFTAKTEARANLQLDVALEDAGIETGRGKDYAKPIRTDFPVVDDLPEEGEVDFTWCDRYELAEDQRTWNVKLKADNAAQEENHQADDNVVDGEIGHADESQQAEQPQLITVATLSLRQRILAQFISDEYVYHIDAEQKKIIQGLELDMDNSYVQNLLLAAENVEFFKNAAEIDISRVVAALKTVFPVEGKRTELSLVMRFIRIWFNTDYIDRGILAREWAAGNRISNVQRTDSGTNADGAHHTLDTLDLEIACALLPMDFNHFEIPGSILRRAKEIVAKKEEPWKSWSSILRNQPGVLGVNRTAIFNLVRIAPENIHLTPVAHLEFVNQTMTAEFNAAVELWPLPVAGAQEPNAQDQPRVENLGAGVFSIDGLMGDQQTHTDDRSPLNKETTSNVQMEEAVSDEEQAGNEVQSGESSLETGEESHTGQQADVNQNTDSVAQNSDSVNQTEPVSAQTEPETQSDEPAVVYPAYFEPGRYEGLPNEVYHAANGISSTQVKDARVSLMFYHGRHVTKTIRRESSEALTFGSLAHTLALEPEKLHEEFAVFPGIPAEAFTTTDSMKAFIREFNADKPKAEQLKLTGKKEELQAAIRAVSPEAIFADEFEQQWCDSVDGKTILSREQLTLATAIQQALLNHESAGKLLRHPSRSVETSYFGMDDETGLEVRVRPDLEVEINGVRIGVDLKTISMGRVKQDGLRAKLHREIIDRDYHLSAGMYCSVADFDQFFWIFVNKDEGYHWVAVIEASEDLLDLGLLEYQRTMRALANAYDTDCWSAPITEDYTDELNDFDLRRLEALRLA
ncbi:PD-(D/E)XK nuclease-like domain-containing protein [Citrobacter sp. Cpo086]|uniref:RecE family exodeoxyribonuclease n=1 Tax=Citrobacter sp. Cpo086 TaxID=2985137 RepID=UPI00257800E7|nr:RecE family exodeoxyribonuclease [Citrobacter sp. Cpo086]MDM2840629.1 PD-(D/E)XK nuclease-like domain-containing protein [Citrobacter sp. Cpo086]